MSIISLIKKTGMKQSIQLESVVRENQIGQNDTEAVTVSQDLGQDADRVDEKPKMTINNPPRNKYRVAALCVYVFSCGYTDAAPGALLPFIEKYYNINYTLVSLVWMSNAVGFLIVAALASKIQPLLGRQYSFMLGIFLSAIHFSIVSAGSHFALTVAAFAFGGAGLAMCLAQTNVFLANLEKLTLYLSYTHGAYGLGATISPLLGTLIASHGIPWHFVYLINLGQMVISFVLVGLAFQGSEKDLKQFEADSTEDEVSDRSPSSKSTMREAVTNRITWIFAFLILFYQGSEVSISGWCVTYLIDYKGGDINSIGYVALAFWAGLTFGRLFLTHPSAKYFGVRRSLLVMCFITIVVVVLAWALPTTIAASTFVALAGIWIGPLYSYVVGTSVKPGMLPRKIQYTSLTIITAFGSAGGAIFPFIIGLLSEPAGSFVVFPVFLVLYSSIFVLWAALPNIERNTGGKPMTLWQRLW